MQHKMQHGNFQAVYLSGFMRFYDGFESHPLRQLNHLSKSEPLLFGQRQGGCYNSFYNAVLWLFDPNFKMDAIIKTAQNWILNMKKDGIRTPSVRFEML